MGVVFTALASWLLSGAFKGPADFGAFLLRTEDVSGPDVEAMASLRAQYVPAFDLNPRSSGRTSLFIPEYDFIERSRAELYLYFFDIGELMDPTDENLDNEDPFYHFIGTRGELKVSKFYNRIIAKFNPIDPELITINGTKGEPWPLTEMDAVEIALSFMESTPLPFSYAEFFVDLREEGLEVTFLREVGGLILWDHPTVIWVDSHGNVISMDYHYLTYEEIATVGLISMEEAYYRLPSMENDSPFRVELTGAALVYRFWDSILQPAYLFVGRIIGADDPDELNEPFRYYISAARFN